MAKKKSQKKSTPKKSVKPSSSTLDYRIFAIAGAVFAIIILGYLIVSNLHKTEVPEYYEEVMGQKTSKTSR